MHWLVSTFIAGIITTIAVHGATDIQGVVNAYAAVTDLSACTNTVECSDVSLFSTGDTVLIIQMLGAHTDAAGDITSMGEAGRFERNVIERITGRSLLLRYRMLREYEPGQGLQVVRIPSYTSARVVHTLTAQPWNGSTGGVLAITVRDTLYLDADVDVSAMGFRPDEGIGRRTTDGGARNVATAGRPAEFAGGVPVRGGGGGSHVGCGGRGYGAGSGITARGVSYEAGVNWIFMGGGGGSCTSAEASGGAGGGIAIVEAAVIVGDSTRNIRASGQDAPALLYGPSGPCIAGGGGGAGGAILCTAPTLRGVKVVDVSGGAGAARAVAAAPGGGGGGGGVIRLGTLTPLNLNPSAYDGGAGGVNITAPGRFDGDSGCAGQLYYNIFLNEATGKPVTRTLAVSADTAMCIGATAHLGVTTNGNARWYRNDGAVAEPLCADCDTITVTPQQSTVYRVVVTYADGCIDSADVEVTVHPMPVFTLGVTQAICPGDTAVVHVTPGFARYQWSTGDTTSSIAITEPGMVWVRVWNAEGCSVEDSVRVPRRVVSPPSVDELARLPALELAACYPHELRERTITLRSGVTEEYTVASAAFMNNAVFSVAQHQVPFVVPAYGTAPLAITASAAVPGHYTDTLLLRSACSEVIVPCTIVIWETPAFSRCKVRVTSDGELEALVHIDPAQVLVYDVMGQLVPVTWSADATHATGLAHGAYVVVASGRILGWVYR